MAFLTARQRPSTAKSGEMPAAPLKASSLASNWSPICAVPLVRARRRWITRTVPGGIRSREEDKPCDRSSTTRSKLSVPAGRNTTKARARKNDLLTLRLLEGMFTLHLPVPSFGLLYVANSAYCQPIPEVGAEITERGEDVPIRKKYPLNIKQVRTTRKA